MWYLYTGGSFEFADELQNGNSVACAEVKYLNRRFCFSFDKALYGDDMGFGQIDHVDIVADA